MAGPALISERFDGPTSRPWPEELRLLQGEDPLSGVGHLPANAPPPGDGPDAAWGDSVLLGHLVGGTEGEEGLPLALPVGYMGHLAEHVLHPQPDRAQRFEGRLDAALYYIIYHVAPPVPL